MGCCCLYIRAREKAGTDIAGWGLGMGTDESLRGWMGWSQMRPPSHHLNQSTRRPFPAIFYLADMCSRVHFQLNVIHIRFVRQGKSRGNAPTCAGNIAGSGLGRV